MQRLCMTCKRRPKPKRFALHDIYLRSSMLMQTIYHAAIDNLTMDELCLQIGPIQLTSSDYVFNYRPRLGVLAEVKLHLRKSASHRPRPITI